LALWSSDLRQISQLSISVLIGKLGTPIAYLCMSLTRRECMCPRHWCQMMRRASRVKWLTYQVTSLSGSSRIETSVAESSRGGSCGSKAGELHGLQVAQQVQCGGDQGGSVGVTTGLAGGTTGSDNGDTGEAASMAGSGSLAAAAERGNSRAHPDLVIERTQIVVVGWNRVGT
jgi:hypothetical protein